MSKKDKTEASPPPQSKAKEVFSEEELNAELEAVTIQLASVTGRQEVKRLSNLCLQLEAQRETSISGELAITTQSLIKKLIPQLYGLPQLAQHLTNLLCLLPSEQKQLLIQSSIKPFIQNLVLQYSEKKWSSTFRVNQKPICDKCFLVLVAEAQNIERVSVNNLAYYLAQNINLWRTSPQIIRHLIQPKHVIWATAILRSVSEPSGLPIEIIRVFLVSEARILKLTSKLWVSVFNHPKLNEAERSKLLQDKAIAKLTSTDWISAFNLPRLSKEERSKLLTDEAIAKLTSTDWISAFNHPELDEEERSKLLNDETISKLTTEHWLELLMSPKLYPNDRNRLLTKDRVESLTTSQLITILESSLLTKIQREKLLSFFGLSRTEKVHLSTLWRCRHLSQDERHLFLQQVCKCENGLTEMLPRLIGIDLADYLEPEQVFNLFSSITYPILVEAMKHWNKEQVNSYYEKCGIVQKLTVKKELNDRKVRVEITKIKPNLNKSNFPKFAYYCNEALAMDQAELTQFVNGFLPEVVVIANRMETALLSTEPTWTQKDFILFVCIRHFLKNNTAQ